MRHLEDIARTQGLSAVEVRKTYEAVGTLLESKAEEPTQSEERHHLAEQVLRQAADPMTVDQGNHQTCGATALEAGSMPGVRQRLPAWWRRWPSPDDTIWRTAPWSKSTARACSLIRGRRLACNRAAQPAHGVFGLARPCCGRSRVARVRPCPLQWSGFRIPSGGWREGDAQAGVGEAHQLKDFRRAASGGPVPTGDLDATMSNELVLITVKARSSQSRAHLHPSVGTRRIEDPRAYAGHSLFPSAARCQFV